MEAHTKITCGCDFRGEQVACSRRMNVEVVGRRRASGQCEFCEADPRRHMCRFFVQCAPQRIQRLQPSEQRGIRHRGECPREVLIQVMVSVDESRSDETVGCVDDDVSQWLIASLADVGDQSVGDGDESTRDLSSLFVNRRNERCVANEEVCSRVQPLSSTSSLPSWRISASR